MSFLNENQYYYLKHLILIILFFILFYLIPNHFLAGIFPVHRFYFSFELQIPFVPLMAIPYNSAMLYFLLPFFLKSVSKDELSIFSFSMNFSLIIASFFFIFFPTVSGFTREIPYENGFLLGLSYQILYFLDSPYNMAPSMHICYTTLIFLFTLPFLPSKFFKISSALWALTIFISTLLTHQHHIPDILTGLVLALFSRWFSHKCNAKIQEKLAIFKKN